MSSLSKIMIVFIYGQDTYRSWQKLKEIVGQYKKIHKSGLNLRYVDLEKDDFQSFRNDSRTVSMFDEKKLVILRNCFSDKDIEKEFLEKGKSFFDSKDVFVFYETGKILKSDSLFKYLIKNAKTQEFKLLEGMHLVNWIEKEFDEYGVKISPEALGKLIASAGDDMWRLNNEIRKLAGYKMKEKTISAEDVGVLVRPKYEVDIFRTIDAVAENNKKKALFFIRRHMDKGESPFYIFSMIQYQFKNLLNIRSLIDKNVSFGKMVKEVGLHPFVLQKTYAQATKFSYPVLKKIYRKIFQADCDIKTGVIDIKAGLDLLIAEI